MANSNLIHFVFPLEENRHLVDLVTKKRFNDIEPRPMGWGREELEAVWNGREVSFRFFGNVRGIIIEDHSNLDIWGIEVVKFLKK